MTSDIEINRDGAVQIVRLVRPQKKNALTQAMYSAIAAALRDGDRDPSIRAHVLTGTSGVFTAGNDIADFLAAGRDVTAFAEAIRAFLTAIATVDKPLIAAVDGLAIGVGTTLLFHCDLVYATPSSRFSTPFLALGLVPEAASSLLMPQRMGYARAFEMLVLGETFSAERAREAEFVNAVVGADELEKVALGAAQRLAAAPPNALKNSRSLMRGDRADILKRIDVEAALFLKCLASPEAQKAFAAFLSKKPGAAS